MSGYELRSIAEQEAGDELRGPTSQLRGTPDKREELPEVRLITPGLTTDTSGQPVDTYKIVFTVLLLHGIGTLMPWNMFINAQDYFRSYKLQPENSTVTPQDRDVNEAELDNLRKNFLSYLGLASQIPNALFNGLNLLVNLGSGNLRFRVNLSLAVEAMIFMLTIVLAVVNSYAWPGAFFYITMISVVVLNMASGVYQNCVFGIGAKFPGSYTNAILIGSNLSGTFTSVVNLLAIWLAPEPKEAAMYYFITALFVILLCLISYNLLNMNSFFRHFDSKRQSPEDASSESAEEKKAPTLSNSNNHGTHRTKNNDVPEALRKTVDAMVPRQVDAQRNTTGESTFMSELNIKWQVFKKCWTQCLNVFFTFFITLALFPSVMANIQQSQGLFNNRYFVAFACFFVFNLFAMLGNLLSSWTTWPGKERVWIVVAARILFIPFFLLCNFNPNSRRWPVYIKNDLIYMAGNVLLASTSGYLSSLCMMFASSGLRADEAPKAGMLAAFFLVFGIVIGINSSFLLTWIVEIG